LGALSVCLDTSVVVALFLPDPFVGRAHAFLAGGPTDVVISEFASAEFASVAGLRVRTRALTRQVARAAFSSLDGWTMRYAISVEMLADDVRAANVMLRRLDLVLRAPDAIHIAIARRLGAELATFDARMAASARALGVPVAAI
jgi:predicted nucleic acid-binding protein